MTVKNHPKAGGFFIFYRYHPRANSSPQLGKVVALARKILPRDSAKVRAPRLLYRGLRS